MPLDILRRRTLALCAGAVLAVVASPVVTRAGEMRIEAMTADQISAAQADGAVVIDIRRPEEWAETGVLPGARLITFVDTDSFLGALGPDMIERHDLILVCHSGRRSGLAADALWHLLPNAVVSVDGGMSRLIAEGATVVPPSPLP